MKIRIKIQGGLMFLGLGAVILLSDFVFYHHRQPVLDGMLDALGMGLILFGFLFRISARGYKEEKSSNGNALVKDGPYAIIRNPMYFGTFMIGIGVVAILLKPWVLLLFGQEYKGYCRITHKYLPRIDYLLKINQYVSLKPFWIRKEIIPFISTVIIIILLKMLECAGFLGHN
jgi:hypothetical protein